MHSPFKLYSLKRILDIWKIVYIFCGVDPFFLVYFIKIHS